MCYCCYTIPVLRSLTRPCNLTNKVFEELELLRLEQELARMREHYPGPAPAQQLALLTWDELYAQREEFREDLRELRELRELNEKQHETLGRLKQELRVCRERIHVLDPPFEPEPEGALAPGWYRHWSMAMLPPLPQRTYFH